MQSNVSTPNKEETPDQSAHTAHISGLLKLGERVQNDGEHRAATPAANRRMRKIKSTHLATT
jgi:hypothetical protein